MKKFVALGLLSLSALCAHAQYYMRIWQNEESTRLPLSELVYQNGGTSFTANGTSYNTAEVDSITMVHTVMVNFDGNTATVDLGAAKGVTYTVDGANVVITNENTTEETEYILSGTSSDGSLTYNGVYKCKFHLNNLNLTSKKGSPLNIQCGKRIDLVLGEGTENTLIDGATGDQKACLYCKGHMEIGGAGTLNVTGNARHAIATKEYLIIKKSAGLIRINKAASDAIHAGQYFQMNGGNIEISGMAGDGIQIESTLDTTDEFNGQAFIKGGSINMKVAADDTKGIKCEKNLEISGGDIKIEASGAGSKGISCDYDMFINENDAPTNIQVTATGGQFTDAAGEKVKCMGIKVEHNLTISAGTVNVKATGTKAKSIKVGYIYYAKGGKVTASPEIDYDTIKH